MCEIFYAYFTSLKDDSVGGDTNRDGSASVPRPFDWNYVSIGTGKASFDWVELRYGSNGISTIRTTVELKVTNCDISYMSHYGIYVAGSAKVTILGNKIHHNGNSVGDGVEIINGGANTEITGNEFYNNARGIRIMESASSKITANYFHNNGIGVDIMMDSDDQNTCLIEHNNFENNVSYGLENWTPNNPPIAVAENNWWDSADGPYPIGSGDVSVKYFTPVPQELPGVFSF